MSAVEFAVPISSVGREPRVIVWQDEDFLRIRIQSSDELILDPTVTSSNASRSNSSSGTGVVSDDWSSDGVHLPGGTELRFEYGGDEYTGVVTGGALAFGETRHGSPSGAIMAAVKERTGRSINLNGWQYIEVLKPNGKTWIPLYQLRTRVRTRG